MDEIVNENPPYKNTSVHLFNSIQSHLQLADYKVKDLSLCSLQQRLEDISNVDEGILNKLENEDEIEHKILEIAEFKDFIYKTIVNLEFVLKNFEHQTKQPKLNSKLVPSFSTKLRLPTFALKDLMEIRVNGRPYKKVLVLQFMKTRICST